MTITEYVLRTPPGGVRRYDHNALCDLLEIADRSRVIFEQGVGREAIVRIYPTNPLTNMRPATTDDLVMDDRGRVPLGTYFDGAPLRYRLFDPKTGNAQRGAIFGTTGAGKSRLVQALLIACKRSGIVVHLADLKEGQSVPEAVGQVATRVTTQADAILMLRGLVHEANRRMRAYADMGRSGFLINRPDPLVYGIIDEANRLLEKGAPHRDEAATLIKELGRTGRSVGVGIIIAAQAGHLDELGGSDTLRAMLKEGEVILLRWSSGMMQQLVGDGLIPRGEALQPIPKVVGQVRRVRRYTEPATSDEDDVNSQGMLYHLSGPRPTSMGRTYLIGSTEPCEGHDPVILNLYGDSPPPGDPIDLITYMTAKERKAAHGGKTTHDHEGDHDHEYDDENSEEEHTPDATTMTTADRILATLPPTGLTEAELATALNHDGGRTVRRGTLRTTISTLRANGRLARPDGTGRIVPTA